MPPVPYLGKYFKQPLFRHIAMPFLMYQPQPQPIDKFIPRLKVDVYKFQRKMTAWPDTSGRQIKLRTIINDLIRYERIEVEHYKSKEAQPYVEYIIQDAVRFGALHKPTMELASHWLHDKDLLHKLFKVLVPRYQNYNTSYTRVFRLPSPRPGRMEENFVLELKGNPFPPVRTNHRNVSNSFANILLAHAREDFYNKNPHYLEEHTLSDTTVQEENVAEENVAAITSGSEADAVVEEQQQLEPIDMTGLKTQTATVVTIYDPKKLEKFARDDAVPERLYNLFKGPSAPTETSGVKYQFRRR